MYSKRANLTFRKVNIHSYSKILFPVTYIYVVYALAIDHRLLFCLHVRVAKCSQAQTSKSNVGQEEGSASNLVKSAGNPNEQGNNTEIEPAVGNVGNEDTSGLPADNPESEPQQVTHSSNIQVSDHAEEEVQDAPKD